MANKNLIRRMRQLLILVLILAMTMSFATMTAMAFDNSAQGNTVTIPVNKTWDDEGHENERPSEITVNLMNGNTKAGFVKLNAANGWNGYFTVPATDEKVTYTVSEEPVANYRCTVIQQPVADYFGVSSFGTKVTPASTDKYEFIGDLIVAKKGGDYYVWTKEELTDTQKVCLLDMINKANLDGLGKELAQSNTSFEYGFLATFGNGEENVSITKESETQYIEFSKEKAWSLYYAGMLDIVKGTGASIKNTYVPQDEHLPDVEFTKEVVTSGDLDIPYGENGLKFNFQLLNEDGTTWGNESAVVTINSKSPTVTFKNVPDGTYTLTETAVEGWESSIPEKGITVVVNDGKVTFDSAGTLTVTNTYKGTPIEKNGTDVTFTKTVLSTNGAEIPYGENGLKFNFQLLNEDGTTWGNESAVVTTNSKNPTVTFENVPNGTYTLTETAVEGWESSIPEKGITVVVNDGKVTFDSAGTLTVTNTYKGTPTTPPGENGNGGGSIGGGGTVTPPPDQNLEIPETPVEPETPAEPAEPVKPLPDDKHIETEVPKTGDVGTDALTLNLLLLSISALAGTAFYLRRKTSGR